MRHHRASCEIRQMPVHRLQIVLVCCLSLVFLLPFVVTPPVRAGEAIAVGGGVGPGRIGTEGVFIVWPNASLPIAYHTDGGTLGTLSNAQAVALVDSMFGVWQAVPTSKIAYTNAGPIASGAGAPVPSGDVSTLADYNAIGFTGNPIIFDSDGSITDALFGPGNSVLGFAGPQFSSASGGIITAAHAVLNGRFLDGNQANGESTISEFRATLIHEFGHFSGLGHSQINVDCLNFTCTNNSNDAFGIPTMFPFDISGLEDSPGVSFGETLAMDDIAWISWLYPETVNNPGNGQVPFTSVYGMITGTLLASDSLSQIQGGNIIARDITNPRRNAVSVVSGHRFTGNGGLGALTDATGATFNSGSPFGSRDPSLVGAYDFPVPGGASYTVEVESISDLFTFSSSVGPVAQSPISGGGVAIPIPGPPEFYSGASESNSDGSPGTAQNVPVTAGATVSNISIILNGTQPSKDAFDTVASNDTPATATPITNGTISASISPIGASGGDIDVYSFGAPAGSPVFLSVLSTHPAIVLSLVLEIVDSGGNRQDLCDLDSDTIYNEPCFDSTANQLNFVSPSAGTFYLRVFEARNDARVDFTYDLTAFNVVGTPGTVSLDRTSVNFGSQVVGTTSPPQTVVITNNGPGNVALIDAQSTPNLLDFDQAQPLIAGDCNFGTTVLTGSGPGSSCNLRGVFTPRALGSRSITLSITFGNATNSPRTLDLTGTGTPATDNVFTNAGVTGTWQVAGNWSLGHVPILGERAVIDGVAPNSASVTLSSGAQIISVLSLTSSGTLTISAGSLTFTGDSTATNITMNGGGAGGTLTSNAALAISGSLNFSSGTLTGNGIVTISSPLTWSGGTMLGTGRGQFTNNGTANISGGKLNGRTFNNAGTVNLTGSLDVGNNATINNLVGGVFNVAGDVFVGAMSVGGNSSFDNAGTLTKTAGTGFGGGFNSSVFFNNTGTVTSASGTFHFDAGLNQSGATSLTSVQGGTTLAGSVSMADGVLAGAGTVAGGVFVNAGTVNPAGGAATGTLTINGNYTQGAGGILNIQLAGTGAGTFDTLAVNGTATFAGTLNVTGLSGFTPSTGNSFTVITFGARTGDFGTNNLTIGAVTLTKTFFNFNLTLSTPSSINDFTDTTNDHQWTTAGNWSLGHVPTASEDVTIGSNKSPVLASGAQAIKSLAQTTTGVLTISGGSLTFTSISTGTNITISGGTLTANANLTASGTFNLSSGTLNGSGIVSIGSPLNMTGGTMSGTGTTRVNGTGSISGGTLDGRIFESVTPGAGPESNVSIDGTMFMINNATLRAGLGAGIGGRITLNDGSISPAGGSGTITNNGILKGRYSTTFTIGSGISFTNHGTMVLDAVTGTGTLSILSGIASDGDMIVEVPGTLSAPTLTVTGGTLFGTGAIIGNVVNNGATVNPGPFTNGGGFTGTLTINGNYTQGSGGTLLAQLGGTGAGQFDKLVVSGTATLDGTFTASSFSGFNPPSGSSFQVLAYASESGDFTTYNLGVGSVTLTKSLNATNLTLSAPAAAVSDLTIAKAHIGRFPPSPNFTQGQVGATYTITVTNSGGASTSGTVTVVDTLPTGLSATGLAGTGWTCVLGTLTCTRADALAAAGSYPVITLTVNVAGNAPATVTNAVAVSGGGETNTANDSASDPTPVTQLPDLSIAKTHTGNFTQGQIGAIYTITLTNIGSVAVGAGVAGGITVRDPLPPPLTATALAGTGWTCVLGTLTCNRSDTALAVGASYPAITLTVNVAANVGTIVTNAVELFGFFDSNPANDVASDTATVTPVNPDLTITKAHTGNFTQGQVGATYTITVTNSGGAATTGTVTVVDTLPTGLTATALTGTGWACVVGTLTCTRSDALAAGSYPAITLTVTVAGNAAASVINTATVSGGGETNTGNDTANDSTTIFPVNPDLTIAKSHTGNFTQGQVGATYTITVTNSGSGATSGTVTVVDTLPTGLAATALTGTGWACVVGTLTCTRSDALAAAGSYPAITLTVTVASNAAASVTNSVTVSGGGELNTANDSATDPTTVIPLNPDLTITKSHTGNFLQGQVGATYTITVTNGGAAATTGTVTVVDTLPASLTATGLTGTGWVCVLGTLTCTRSDALAAAASYPAITLTVTVSGTAPASVTNSVAVSGGGETNTANDSASDPTTVIPVNPDLTITKTHTGNFTQGQIGATYTITVTNSGGVATTGTVTVVDTLPTGLTATGLTGTGWTCVLATFTCTRADALAASASYPAITLTVDVSGTAAASITNTATVSGGGELNTANDTANDPTTVIQIPDLTIVKSHTGNFTQGQTGATYTITVSNAGPGPTTGTVTVVDTLPAGLTATGLAGTGWVCVVGTLTCTRADALAAAGSYPAITLTVTVATNAAASVTNTVTVSGGGETNAANDSASDPTTINQVSDLTIVKTHTGNFTQGQTGATYTITVTNGGSVATSGTVTVVDTLPAGLTATGLAGSGWTCAVGTLTCTRADALTAAGSYPAITLTVNVANNAAASLTNSVTVSGGGETNTANDSASDPTTVIQIPDLTIAKTHTGNFTQGQTGATYTITVTNSGGAATSGTVTVVDTLPADLTATGLAGTGWACVVGTLTCTRADALAAAASYPAITLTVNVANNAAASVTNSVTVSGGGETNVANDSASDPTTIVQVADLTIAKSHTGNFTQGQTGATYTITVSNAGPGPTTGTVTVVDTLPAGLTATALAGTGWTCVVGTLTCTRADALAAAGSYPVITLTVSVSNSAVASVTNSVAVSGGGEINTANDSASDPTTIIQLPDLTITKSHTGSFTRGLSGQTYTITVTNSGFAATTGMVTVADTLPAGLTATAIAGTGWTCVLATLTCARADALPVSGSYPAITLTVSVATNAGASVTNTVTVSGGGETNAANDSASDPTSVVNPVPTIASISPTHSPAGAAFVLTVNGTNFVNASVVNLNGAAKTTTFVSALQLTAALTAADAATGGAFNVSVTNAAPGGGTSGNLTLTIDDYAVSGPAAAVTVPAGQSANYTITVTPTANGFANAVQFSVAGLPAAATASFNPATLTPGTSPGTTSMTVTTKSRTGAFTPPASRLYLPLTRLPVGWFVLLAMFLMALATVTLRSPAFVRMRFGRIGVVIVLLLCTGYLAGCVKTGFPEGNQGTPAGTSTLTVTATSGSAQHTTTVTLTVQ